MALQLPVDKPGKRDLQKIVRDAAASQLDAALKIFRRDLREPRQQDEAVHELRKRLKEVRALARLVREGLGEELFQQINTTLRDVGRPLSEVRDATAIMEALDKLPGPKAAVHAKLLESRTAVRRKVIGDELALERAEHAIQIVRKDCEQWTVSGSWQTLEAGIGAAYRKGRRAMKAALGDADGDRWHEWRKRVKDLRYQLEMLAPLWPAVMEAMAEEAHRLTDLLGDDHDLSVLVSLAGGLKTVIEKRRKELRAEAELLGRKVFAEKVKAFVKRVGVYWEDADGESAAEGH